MSDLCRWGTYNHNYCKKNAPEYRFFCKLHEQMAEKFRFNNMNICGSSEDVHIEARSYKHVIWSLTSLGIDDLRVQVIKKNQIHYVEDASIENEEYILMDSDDSKYYYKPTKKDHKKTTGIFIVCKKYCKNRSFVRYESSLLCEECYSKLKNVPNAKILMEYREHTGNRMQHCGNDK